VSPVDAARPGADLLEAFRQFPTASALLARDGSVAIANKRFAARFGPEGIALASRQAAIESARGRPEGWCDVMVTAAGASLAARVIALTSRVLLVVDDAGEGVAAQELAALRERLARLENDTATDYLTGAWNRAHFDRVIGVEIARSEDGRRSVALVLIDIDHFKQVNDRFGHAAGDHVLRELVRLIRLRVRASDVLFRWGGEEFALLVSGAGYRGAGTVADNVRRAVLAHDFEGVGRLTVSAGVAEHDAGEDAAAWFARLDAALYEAKRTGRNRVVVDRRGASDSWATQAGGAALHLHWMEGLECGDPVIDAEHREIFRLANALIDAAWGVRGASPRFAGALDDLVEHVAMHFADEEEILAARGYLQLEEHRRAHAGLLRRAREMSARAGSGDVRPADVVEFLVQDVVARHIIAVDRAFFPLFAPG